MRKRIRVLLLIAGCCALVAFLAGGRKIVWVGSTDLTVEFVATDADTGQPLAGAEIVILSEGGLYEGGDRLREKGLREEFSLKTDANGGAESACRGSMCSGTSGALGLTNTFAVRMPYWSITVKAPGYQTVAPFFLDPQYGRKAERTGPGRSKAVVPIALHQVTQ